MTFFHVIYDGVYCRCFVIWMLGEKFPHLYCRFSEFLLNVLATIYIGIRQKMANPEFIFFTEIGQMNCYDIG